MAHIRTFHIDWDRICTYNVGAYVTITDDIVSILPHIKTTKHSSEQDRERVTETFQNKIVVSGSKLSKGINEMPCLTYSFRSTSLLTSSQETDRFVRCFLCQQPHHHAFQFYFHFNTNRCDGIKRNGRFIGTTIQISVPKVQTLRSRCWTKRKREKWWAHEYFNRMA